MAAHLQHSIMLLLVVLVCLVEADWAEVDAAGDGAACMLQHNAKSLGAIDPGFINLYMLYVKSRDSRRQEEYCVSIRENAKQPAVREVNLITKMNESSTWSSMADTCKLPQDLQKKIKVHADYKESELTYKTMLSTASNATSPDTLQIVMNTDIVLGDEFGTMRHCLDKARRKNAFFHLTRTEPETCFPLLDGLPREQEVTPDFELVGNLCKKKEGSSHDALAFNVPIPKEATDKLDFPPNRMGAENLVSCRLHQAGLKLHNPCSDLPIYHNHCTTERNYSWWRIDLRPDRLECAFFAIPVNSLSEVCS
eukprot:TRINITY_DN80565_c0_g1_i1.p1 TRINITY_DN80565_c0_g1~~TRINITY_DN80565_c0_g1_i1.p1  ORF type:complete len:309 (-),score=62.67 TRINITY_DN80565_c0_g1_i1:16-942(-)